MPASSAIWASRTLSSQLPDQRSGALVTKRPEEQFTPKNPSFSRFALYIANRPGIVPFMSRTPLLLVRLPVLRDGLQQGVDVEWLGDVAAGADLAGPTARVLRSGHDHDGQLDASLLHFVGKSPSVHHRHAHIEQHQRREL